MRYEQALQALQQVFTNIAKAFIEMSSSDQARSFFEERKMSLQTMFLYALGADDLIDVQKNLISNVRSAMMSGERMVGTERSINDEEVEDFFRFHAGFGSLQWVLHVRTTHDPIAALNGLKQAFEHALNPQAAKRRLGNLPKESPQTP